MATAVVYVDDIKDFSDYKRALKCFVSLIKSMFNAKVSVGLNKLLRATIPDDRKSDCAEHSLKIKIMLSFFDMEDCNPTQSSMLLRSSFFETNQKIL